MVHSTAHSPGWPPLTRSYFQNAPREPPSKFVTSTVEVQLACRLLFVDLEGVNDGRAVKTIVPQIHPRKMVRNLTLAPLRATYPLIPFRSSSMRLQTRRALSSRVVGTLEP